MNTTNHTQRESPDNFFSFFTEGTIGETAQPKFLYVKENHLGNVLVVVSDRKLAHTSDNITVDYYLADVVSTKDYYAFGWEMPGRSFNPNNYRYSFNGKEDDRELNDWQDYGERMYMKRLGRFGSVDPFTKKYPELSTYQFASNTPIQASDIDGLEQGSRIGYASVGGGIPLLVTATDRSIQGIQFVQYEKVNQKANTSPATLAVIKSNQDDAATKKAVGEIRPGPTPVEKLRQSLEGTMEGQLSETPVIKAIATGGLAGTAPILASGAIGTAAPALTGVSVGGTTVAEGLGSAAGDALSQSIMTGKVNVTQSAASFGFSFLKNPAVGSFGAAAVGSAGEFNIGGNSGYHGLNFDESGKSFSQFGLETGIGGLSGLAAGAGTSFLSKANPYQPVSYGSQVISSFFHSTIANTAAGAAGAGVQNAVEEKH